MPSFNLSRHTSRSPTKVRKPSQESNTVCGRLIRSVQNRGGRIDVINKIFRKQRKGKVYRFDEKNLTNKIKQMTTSGEIKSPTKDGDYGFYSIAEDMAEPQTVKRQSSKRINIKTFRRLSTQNFNMMTPIQVPNFKVGRQSFIESPRESKLFSISMFKIWKL